MTIQTPSPIVQVLPETAPFSEAQRSWLNGFFAGLLSLDNAGVTALSPTENAAVMAEADDGAPWHDPSLAITERMQLAEGKPLPRRLFAAMAQQDCGQCGYVCETYSAAIASGAEARLNLCAPGGKDTLRQLKTL
ncbi:MAG: sulfite reductase subunit alpha, partial [Methylobacterium sp.]|nr:sulfite reductase subunit alpha [Methylobacterium sp.]